MRYIACIFGIISSLVPALRGFLHTVRYFNGFIFYWPPLEARIKEKYAPNSAVFADMSSRAVPIMHTRINCHFVWLQVVGTSANLTLDVDADTAGRYYCKASVMGFPEVGAEASVFLKGPPTIISHRTQFGIQGDNVRLECVAFSIPKPEHVTWTYNGNEVDADDKDYTILEDPLPEGIKSTLVIRESRQQHFGPYNCSVTNPYGSDVVEINLRPQSKRHCSPLKLLES
jgi:hypothetical protein